MSLSNRLFFGGLGHYQHLHDHDHPEMIKYGCVLNPQCGCIRVVPSDIGLWRRREEEQKSRSRKSLQLESFFCWKTVMKIQKSFVLEMIKKRREEEQQQKSRSCKSLWLEINFSSSPNLQLGSWAEIPTKPQHSFQPSFCWLSPKLFEDMLYLKSCQAKYGWWKNLSSNTSV